MVGRRKRFLPLRWIISPAYWGDLSLPVRRGDIFQSERHWRLSRIWDYAGFHVTHLLTNLLDSEDVGPWLGRVLCKGGSNPEPRVSNRYLLIERESGPRVGEKMVLVEDQQMLGLTLRWTPLSRPKKRRP